MDSTTAARAPGSEALVALFLAEAGASRRPRGAALAVQLRDEIILLWADEPDLLQRLKDRLRAGAAYVGWILPYERRKSERGTPSAATLQVRFFGDQETAPLVEHYRHAARARGVTRRLTS